MSGVNPVSIIVLLITAFFKTLPKVEIADLLMFIGDRSSMRDGFTHQKDRYLKRKMPIPLAVNACLLDVDYVPSIKNIREAANDLYSVKSPDKYTGIIRPKAAIKVDLIKSQKRGILRILLSLILQENTQSNIIRKLNSHARYARLRMALFEHNKIFKSNHVLNVIDNTQLRKVLRTARNRTEQYHQLQGLIRKIYSGIFKGKRIVDNRISAHSARLIANCIIAYNSIILNAVYEKMLENGVEKRIVNEYLTNRKKRFRSPNWRFTNVGLEKICNNNI